jgi:hypothetical protein
LASERSAAGTTVVSALALLSEGSGSETFEVTLARLVIKPVDCGLTLTSTVAFSLALILWSEQVTVPAFEGAVSLRITDRYNGPPHPGLRRRDGCLADPVGVPHPLQRHLRRDGRQHLRGHDDVGLTGATDGQGRSALDLGT